MKSLRISGVAGAVFLLALLLLPAAAIAEDSGDIANSYYNLGVRALSANDFAGAIGFFDKTLAANTSVIARSDTLMYLYENKAYAQIKLGRFEDARNTTETGLALYPRDAKLWNNKGFALSQLGRNKEAVTAYDQAIALDGTYTTALINKADALYQLGEYRASVAAYTSALGTDPNNPDTAAGLKKAQAAADAFPPVLIAVVVLLLIIAGGAIWYLKFRKPEEKKGKTGKEKGRKKKK